MNTTTNINPKTRRGPRTVTPASQGLRRLAATWNAMDAQAKSTWQALAGRLAEPLKVGQPSRVNAYATFCQLNSAVLASGGAIQQYAPEARQTPPALPPVLLTADFDESALRLTLAAASPTGRVLLYGAAPALSGKPVYDSAAFVLLGSLPNLGAPHDVAALYTARFAVPGPGWQLSLRVIPVTPAGFKGQPLVFTAVVTVPSLAARRTDDPPAPALKAA